MAPRPLGALLAIVAAIALVVSLASSAWWSGKPVVNGQTISAKHVRVGLLGATGCNTGGDGRCESLEVAGSMKVVGYGEMFIILGTLITAFALAAAAWLVHPQRRTVALVTLGLVGASVVGALLVLVTGPAIRSGARVSVPIGWGFFVYVGGAISAAVAALVTRSLASSSAHPRASHSVGYPLQDATLRGPGVARDSNPHLHGAPYPGSSHPGIPLPGHPGASHHGMSASPVAPSMPSPLPPPPTGASSTPPPPVPSRMSDARARAPSMPPPIDRTRGRTPTVPPSAGAPRGRVPSMPSPVAGARGRAPSMPPPVAGARGRAPSMPPPVDGARRAPTGASPGGMPGARAGSAPRAQTTQGHGTDPGLSRTRRTSHGVGAERPASSPAITAPPAVDTEPVQRASAPTVPHAVPPPPAPDNLPPPSRLPALQTAVEIDAAAKAAARAAELHDEHEATSQTERLPDADDTDGDLGTDDTSIGAPPRADAFAPTETLDPRLLSGRPGAPQGRALSTQERATAHAPTRDRFDAPRSAGLAAQTSLADHDDADSVGPVTDVQDIPTEAELAAALEAQAPTSASRRIAISTAPSSLPPPSFEVAGEPTPACPQCDAPMTWVEEHLRFYCKQCRMYF